jgi:hypothetical protein
MAKEEASRHQMSLSGQNAKYSERADDFRFAPNIRHCSIQSACLKGANSDNRRSA